MKRIFLIVAFLLSAAAAHAQSPTTACNSINLNAAYSDNVNNVQYMCTAIGWKQNIGIGNPVVACAPKNYGQNYTDVSTPATFQCGEAGWFSITGGGGGDAPGGSNQDVQFNSSGVFGGNSSLTFNPSATTLALGPLGTATSVANYDSGIFQTCASTWNGSAAIPDCWQWQVQPIPGTNPYSELTLSHVGSSGGQQLNLPSTLFGLGGFAVNSLNDSGEVEFQGPMNMPSGSYQIFMPAVAPSGSNNTLSCPFTSGYYKCVWTAGGSGAAVTPQQFGGYGDAYSAPDGCTTIASNTTVTCQDSPFVSGDVGKHIWVQGAGAAGVAFNGVITAVTDNADVVVTPAPSTSVAYGVLNNVYGHDDTVATQACLQYSSSNSIPCVMNPLPTPAGQTGPIGFLIGTSPGLQLPVNNGDLDGGGPSILGSSLGVTVLFCEYNGDCLSLGAGPIVGANMSNFELRGDPTQPAGRAFHFNAQAGTYGNGGLWNSTFNNILVNNFALECMWMDGGGGAGYNYLLPNQIDTFTQFMCDGPNQSHPANLIKMTGQAAQILFQNGQVNGYGWSGGSSSEYPNPLIAIEEKTTGLSDTPSDVKFFGYTYEVGTQGLYVGEGGYNIHFDNSYIENVSSPLIVNGGTGGAQGLTFNGNHIANSGNIGGIAQFTGSTGSITGGMRDNFEYGGAVTVTTLATCSGAVAMDFASNTINGTGPTTSGCATTVAIAGGTQSANSCSSPTTVTLAGIIPTSVVEAGYSSNPSGINGWGTTGGMVFQAWPSAANQLSWEICNQTASSITYGAITFNLAFK